MKAHRVLGLWEVWHESIEKWSGHSLKRMHKLSTNTDHLVRRTTRGKKTWWGKIEEAEERMKWRELNGWWRYDSNGAWFTETTTKFDEERWEKISDTDVEFKYRSTGESGTELRIKRSVTKWCIYDGLDSKESWVQIRYSWNWRRLLKVLIQGYQKVILCGNQCLNILLNGLIMTSSSMHDARWRTDSFERVLMMEKIRLKKVINHRCKMMGSSLSMRRKFEQLWELVVDGRTACSVHGVTESVIMCWWCRLLMQYNALYFQIFLHNMYCGEMALTPLYCWKISGWKFNWFADLYGSHKFGHILSIKQPSCWAFTIIAKPKLSANA